jgi:hypothetical protein
MLEGVFYSGEMQVLRLCPAITCPAACATYWTAQIESRKAYAQTLRVASLFREARATG